MDKGNSCFISVNEPQIIYSLNTVPNHMLKKTEELWIKCICFLLVLRIHAMDLEKVLWMYV
jgi:hypothetical protein